MANMKRIGGSTEWINTQEGYVQMPYALYQCKEGHLVKVFPEFHGLRFLSWEDAPAELDMACLYCNIIIAGAEDDD